MSLFFQRDSAGASASSLLGERTSGRRSTRSVSAESALRHSAVWACLRLRANLISSLPVDYYRKVGNLDQVEVSKPLELKRPGALYLGGSRVSVAEWIYATQIDLDRYGNTFGLVVERNALALPSRIDLVEAASVSVRVKDGQLSYKIGRKTYDPVDVWHERQYVTAGLPVGLSPIAHAALSIGQYLSAQEFAAGWFAESAVPKSRLRNTKRTMTNDQARETKRHVKQQLADGDLLVLGSDWEWDMIDVPTASAQWIETQQFSVADVCRFLDVPGDMIDAQQSGSSVTYANLTQRNLQLLIQNLGPAVKRREDALSSWSAEPRFVKLNTDALLRMDPLSRDELLTQQVASKRRTITEARALDNLPPLTPEQEDEIARLSGARAAEPTKTDTGKG